MSESLFPSVLPIDSEQVIDAAQERILKSANPKNILTAGYRQVNQGAMLQHFLKDDLGLERRRRRKEGDG